MPTQHKDLRTPLEQQAAKWLGQYPEHKIFPVKGKIPFHGFKWQQRASNETWHFNDLWHKATGYAIVTDGTWMWADIDDADAVPTEIAEALSGNPWMTTTAGGPGRYRFLFRVTGQPVEGKHILPDGAGDIRSGSGAYVVGPGSVHPVTGDIFAWPSEKRNTVTEAPETLIRLLTSNRQHTTDPDDQPDEFIPFRDRYTYPIEHEHDNYLTAYTAHLVSNYSKQNLGDEDLKTLILNRLRKAVKEDLTGIDETRPFTEMDFRRYLKSALSKYRKNPRTSKYVQLEWYGAYDSELLARSLKAVNTDLRLNVRSGLTEWLDEDGNWEPLGDYKEEALYEDMANATRISMPKKTKNGEVFESIRPQWEGAKGKKRYGAQMAYLYAHQVDPFKDYLNSLEEWDGIPRIHNLFRLAGINPTPGQDPDLLEWASAATPLAVVYRTFTPGYKYDCMVILVGEQGCGKGTYWQWHLPEAMQPLWYTDSFEMRVGTSQGTKAAVEVAAGKVIVECAELAGLRKSDLEAMKAWQSRQTDTVRLAYRKHADPHPRRYAVVGSTNERESLPNDPTGNRRWVPVEINGGQYEKIKGWWEQNRDQVWAEAVHLYKQKHPLYLPVSLAKSMREATEKHRQKDQLAEDVVSAFLTTYHMEEFTIAQIFTPDVSVETLSGSKLTEGRLTLPPTRANEMAVARVLLRLGYKKKRKSKDGVRSYWWSHPEAPAENARPEHIPF